MSDVFDMEDYREVWTNTKVDCLLCGTNWVGTHHVDTFALECPICATMNPIRKPITYSESFQALAWAFERLFHRIALVLTGRRSK